MELVIQCTRPSSQLQYILFMFTYTEQFYIRFTVVWVLIIG